MKYVHDNKGPKRHASRSTAENWMPVSMISFFHLAFVKMRAARVVTRSLSDAFVDSHATDICHFPVVSCSHTAAVAPKSEIRNEKMFILRLPGEDNSIPSQMIQEGRDAKQEMDSLF